MFHDEKYRWEPSSYPNQLVTFLLGIVLKIIIDKGKCTSNFNFLFVWETVRENNYFFEIIVDFENTNFFLVSNTDWSWKYEFIWELKNGFIAHLQDIFFYLPAHLCFETQTVISKNYLELIINLISIYYKKIATQSWDVGVSVCWCVCAAQPPREQDQHIPQIANH